MSIFKKALGVAAVGAVITGGAVVGLTGSAQAANVGTLTLVQHSGTTQTPIDATSSGVCPVDAAGIYVELIGSGLSFPNNLMMGFTDISLVDDGDHYTLPTSVTMFDLFQQAGVANPAGTYTIQMDCIESDFFTIGDTYSTTINLTPTATSFLSNFTWAAPAEDTTTVLSGPASANPGDSVTFTAAVTPNSVAGSVQFKDGATNLGAPQTVAGGTASITTSALSSGTHHLTAVFTPSGAGFNPSTSNTHDFTVGTVTTSLDLTSNGPTEQYAPAIFTATVSPAAAGDVVFSEGATVLATVPVNGAGVASYSTTGLAPGTHSVDAEFVPDNPGSVTGSTDGPVDHVVTAFAGASVTQNVIVEVPAGALTIVLDDGADGIVDLGTAVMDPAGDKLTASGDMDVVKITDTRAGDPGWTASGVVTDFAHGTDAINGYNLGWTPEIVSLSANQTANFDIGDPVNPANEGTATSVPSDLSLGLESSRTLGAAPDNSGNGTAKLGAGLALNIPTDVPAGVYNALLTLTVI